MYWVLCDLFNLCIRLCDLISVPFLVNDDVMYILCSSSASVFVGLEMSYKSQAPSYVNEHASR